MGGKLMAILLFVVGAGLLLYFINSGGGTKLGAIFSPHANTASSTASSTVTLSTSTIGAPSSGGSGSTGGSSSNSASTTKATSTNFFITFLNELFHPSAVTLPNLSGGSSGGYISNTSGGSSENGGSNSGSSGSETPSTSSIPAYEIPTGFTLSQLSPYFHWIRFYGVGSYDIGLTAPGNPNGYNEATTTIDITGWEIKTRQGGEYIPQAVNIYDPDAAPVLSDLVLTTGGDDVVYLYSTSAPVNLRLNECMGYLNATTNQFSPALPYSCPPVSSTVISQFSGACQNYIESLGCNPVDMNSPYIPRNDYACQQYLQDNFTYDSCISNNAHDPNFLADEWHIWMGSSPLDSYHDTVELLDKNGLVVDVYSY